MLKRITLSAIAAAILFCGVAISNAQPKGGKGKGPRRSPEVATIESPSLGKSKAEQRVLDVLKDMEGQRRGHMNVPTEDGRLLRLLAATSGARHVVEIGTSNGYSSLWFCLALRDTGGRLTTLEIDEGRAAEARGNFKRAGVEDLITLVMGDAHETVKDLKGPIDIVFIDADKPGYPDYLEKVLPKVRPGGLIIGHNMRSPAPSPEYIKAVTSNPELETLFLNMHAAGIGVSLKKH